MINVFLKANEGGTCSRGAIIYVIQNIDNGSALFFTTKLDILQDVIGPWLKYDGFHSYRNFDLKHASCPAEIDYEAVKNNFKAQVKNIKLAENLSESDTKKVHEFYRMISTFKYLD
ncbi:MAG: hypothetical protein WD512_09440 [Candidatus Paceibacterota bacterium]